MTAGTNGGPRACTVGLRGDCERRRITGFADTRLLTDFVRWCWRCNRLVSLGAMGARNARQLKREVRHAEKQAESGYMAEYRRRRRALG